MDHFKMSLETKFVNSLKGAQTTTHKSLFSIVEQLFMFSKVDLCNGFVAFRTNYVFLPLM